jgi:hypothetical protein
MDKRTHCDGSDSDGSASQSVDADAEELSQDPSYSEPLQESDEDDEDDEGPLVSTADPYCFKRGKTKIASDFAGLLSDGKKKLEKDLEDAKEAKDIAATNLWLAALRTYNGSEKTILTRRAHELEWRKFRLYCVEQLGVELPSLKEAPPLQSQIISYFQFVSPSFWYLHLL